MKRKKPVFFFKYTNSLLRPQANISEHRKQVFLYKRRNEWDRNLSGHNLFSHEQRESIILKVTGKTMDFNS